jgi:hypothetical protein
MFSVGHLVTAYFFLNTYPHGTEMEPTNPWLEAPVLNRQDIFFCCTQTPFFPDYLSYEYYYS